MYSMVLKTVLLCKHSEIQIDIDHVLCEILSFTQLTNLLQNMHTIHLITIASLLLQTKQYT